jgi:hypothetical protein
MKNNKRFIVNKEILPKGKIGGIDWFKTKEIEVYFKDNEQNYILNIEDVIKDKNKISKILLSYNKNPYERYLQGGQILNGNLETLFNYYGIRGNKLRPFRLSDDETYWIGITDKGEEFYFNGEHSEEIMKYNWHISNGYLVTKISIEKGARLNRMVLGVNDIKIVVNHCGRNKMDNRVEMLSISDYKDNMKELSPSKLNNTGITGLTKIENNDTYRIKCNIKNNSYTNTYKTKEEALIDLLIIQRHYGYRHNENLYYTLDSVSEKYINNLINKVEDKIKEIKVNPIICKNRFELSENGSFYYIYDKKNNRCKISIEDLELVKQGNWRLVLNNGKEYFSGEVIFEGKKKNIFLHRFLLDLTNPKYRHWYIDHLDSDGLNNTKENMVITDAQGNGLNKKRNDIEIRKGKFIPNMKLSGKFHYKSFETYNEAIEWRNELIENLMKNRLEFKSKDELDKYLEDTKNK